MKIKLKMMKLKPNVWIWAAVIVVLVIVVVLVVFLPSSSGTGGTPTLTPTYTPLLPTATGVGYATPTATGVGYATPTATGVGYATPTSTTLLGPTVTVSATPQSTSTPGRNTSYFDQSVYNVKTGGNSFDVYVNWSGNEEPPCYFWGGQFDLSFNESLIDYVSYSNGVLAGVTATYCQVADHGNYIFLTEDWDTWIWNNNNGNGINGSGYWLKLTFTTNASNTGTSHLKFSGPDALEAIKLFNNGYDAEYIEDAAWINSSVVNVNP